MNSALERFAVRRHMIHSYPRAEAVVLGLFWFVLLPLHAPELRPVSAGLAVMLVLSLAGRWWRLSRAARNKQGNCA